MKQKNTDIPSLTKVLHKKSFNFPEGCESTGADIPQHTDKHGFTSVRIAEYHGKAIEIHTTYKIMIDGKPLQTHAMVLDNGKVHTHGLPQYAFSSAIDMARALIRLSEMELPEDELTALAKK